VTRPAATRTPRRRTTRRALVPVLAAVLALTLAASACSSDPSSTGATGSNPSTSITEVADQHEVLTIDVAAMQRTIDETAASLLVPGAMVLVRTPAGTHRLSYGTATLGEQAAPTADTSFRIGSVTKTMTAAVILQLVAEGELALEDTIDTYVAGVPHGATITIAQLLEMRSGLHNYLDTPGFRSTFGADPTHLFTPRDLLDLGFAEPMTFEPGGGYDYSNTNTILLGLVAEQIEDKPLATIYAERLFGPLGMAHTFLPEATSFGLPAPSAHGYQYGPLQVADAALSDEEQAAAEAGTLRPNDVTAQSPTWSWAAGGVVSTAEDLAVWIEALNRGAVLDDATRQQRDDSLQVMHREDPKALYGYGIGQIRFGTNRLTYHEGQPPGFNTMAMDDAANGVTIVVWTNRSVDHDRDIAFSLTANLLDHIYRTPGSTPPADGGS
jgi:D-alanyl-D-alanine carboxypeptidase